MGVVVETVSSLAKEVHYRQTISPTHHYGTFVSDDTDDHQFKVDGRGKGRLSVSVNNPGNQAVTVTVYGLHTSTGVIADAGSFLIGSFAVNAASKGYETINDPFPYYLIQVAHAVAPNDNPLLTCTVYADFESA